MQDQSHVIGCALPSTAVQIAGASAVQVVTPSAAASSGSVVFNLGGSASEAVLAGDNASQIQAKLVAMASIGAGGVVVTGDLTSTVNLTFGGILKLSPLDLVTFTSNTLVDGGSNPITLTPATTQTGVAPLGLGVSGFTLAKESEYDSSSPGAPATFGVNGLARGTVFVQTEQQLTAKTATVYVRYAISSSANEVQNLQFQKPYGTQVVPDAGGTFVLGFNNNFTAQLKLTGTAATDAANIEAALEGLATIGTGNVTVATDGSGGFNITFGSDLAAAPQSFVKVLYCTVASSNAPAFPVVSQTTQGTAGWPVGGFSNATDSGKNVALPSKFMCELGISVWNPNLLQWITPLRINMIK